MTYHIVILDEEPVFVEELSAAMDRIMTRAASDYDIKAYDDSELLEKGIISGRIHCDILFSEILLAGKNGIDLAGNLRAHGFKGSIVFITSHSEYSLAAYSVYPLNYLLKPVDQERLEEVLLKDYNVRCGSHQMLLKGVGGDTIVEQSDVYYFVMKGRKIHAVLRNGEAVLTGTMSELEKELADKPFVRCHKGFIVNVSKIIKINRSEIVLPKGMTIPVGRTYYKMTLECVEHHVHK